MEQKFENEAGTSIRELGEFGLIDRISSATILSHPSTVKGIGDDCAVIDTGGNYLLVTTDMLVYNVHFDLMYTPLMHLGYKAITSSASDIYAMNGSARQVFVSIAISSQFSIEMVDTLFEGIRIACKNYNLDLAGGDTTTIENGLVINVTVVGIVEKEKIVYRSGASKNDLVCVTGDLGAAYLGLLILEREKRIFLENPEIQPVLEGNDYLLKRHLRPEARKDIRGIFDDLKIQPTSMIDISDGLSSDLLHICRNSKVGCKIFEDKIPLDLMVIETSGKFNIDPITCSLNGGEDYELLFTIRQSDYEKIKNHPDFTVIGHISDEENGCKLITRSGSEVTMVAQGWSVFKK